MGPIRPSRYVNKKDCRICDAGNVDSASEWSWYCPILDGPICETHCAEIQLSAGGDTRVKACGLTRERIHPEKLPSAFCATCPFGNHRA